MERKELFEICHKIAGFFDYLNENTEYGEEFPMTNLVNSEEYYERLYSIIGHNEMADEVNGVMWEVKDIAFALGYVIGQKVEMTDPNAQADIEAIYKEIKEHRLLPYLPREKKAA